MDSEQLELATVLALDEQIFSKSVKFWLSKQAALHRITYTIAYSIQDQYLHKNLELYREYVKKGDIESSLKQLDSLISYCEEKNYTRLLKYLREVKIERTYLNSTYTILKEIKASTPTIDNLIKLIDKELSYLNELKNGIQTNLPERRSWINQIDAWIEQVNNKFIVEPEELVNYALNGDTKNKYPYKYLLDYTSLTEDLTYENLIKRISEKLSYLLQRKELQITKMGDFIVWQYEGKPKLFIQKGGKIYVSAKDYFANKPLTYHHAGYLLSILNRLGFVNNFSRARVSLSEEEVNWIKRRM